MNIHPNLDKQEYGSKTFYVVQSWLEGKQTFEVTAKWSQLLLQMKIIQDEK